MLEQYFSICLDIELLFIINTLMDIWSRSGDTALAVVFIKRNNFCLRLFIREKKFSIFPDFTE